MISGLILVFPASQPHSGAHDQREQAEAGEPGQQDHAYIEDAEAVPGVANVQGVQKFGDSGDGDGDENETCAEDLKSDGRAVWLSHDGVP